MFDGDDSPDPLYVTAYWTVYRFLRWNILPWVSPTQWYDRIKYFFQRGVRGWSDRDTWSLDYYLNTWIPDALRRLKKVKHGVPIDMFEGLPCVDENGCSYHSPETFATAEARWDAVMDKIIAGFEAHKRMCDGLYESELGLYPLRRPVDVRKEEWEKIHDGHYAAICKLEERDKLIYEEGMALFVKHYWSLGD